MNFELGILDFIQSHLRCDLLDVIMPAVTKLGDIGFIWLGCIIILLLFPKTRKIGVTAAVSFIFAALCCNVILKPLAARIRPCEINPAVSLLVVRPTDFSFPSGHTTTAFAVSSVLFFSKNRLWIPALILSVLIGFSRLYLYVHYPTDVLAGVLLGIMIGWIGCIFTRFILKKTLKNIPYFK